MGWMNHTNVKPEWRRRLCSLSLNYPYILRTHKRYSPPLQNMLEMKRVNGCRIALAIVHRSSNSSIINDEHTIFTSHSQNPVPLEYLEESCLYTTDNGRDAIRCDVLVNWNFQSSSLRFGENMECWTLLRDVVGCFPNTEYAHILVRSQILANISSHARRELAKTTREI